LPEIKLSEAVLAFVVCDLLYGPEDVQDRCLKFLYSEGCEFWCKHAEVEYATLLKLMEEYFDTYDHRKREAKRDDSLL